MKSKYTAQQEREIAMYYYIQQIFYFVKTYKWSVRTLECYDCCSSGAVMQCCFMPSELYVFSKKRWKHFLKKKCSIFWNARYRIITNYVKTTVFLQGIIYREKLAGISSPFSPCFFTVHCKWFSSCSKRKLVHQSIILHNFTREMEDIKIFKSFLDVCM